jgi:peptidoglycan/xylan/chitin deacetylase (PgdA/CDA1 family)
MRGSIIILNNYLRRKTGGDDVDGKGTLVISLDFELNWGVQDCIPLESYQENLLGARKVIPMMLERFHNHNIHATWAIVGFLFYSNKQTLVNDIPKHIPNYENEKLSSYRHLKHVGENELVDPIHFASSLVGLIAEYEHQEIATHTFSHYYCLEKGQTMRDFEADLKQAIDTAKRQNISIRSFVFPRNQVNTDYLPICKAHQLTSYRGCEGHWLYQAKPSEDGKVKRAIRLLDSYMNISGHHIYSSEKLMNELKIVNIPSSRFLRPYSNKFHLLEGLKRKRIKDSMTKAAKEGKLFHLWWHPHNFGIHLEENLQTLDEIMTHFHMLRDRYGMVSLTMKEFSDKVLNSAKPLSNLKMH